MLRIAINGFGRIGRLVLRAAIESSRNDMQVVAVNDLGSVEQNLHLLKHDSVHGNFFSDLSIDGSDLLIDDKVIHTSMERDPSNLPWKKLDIDIVLECTGLFTDGNIASKHIAAGAKKVLISAPAKNVDATVVYGVNHKKISYKHKIISNASCTTNCLAPIAKILNDSIGIESGFMTTIHSYTGDQNVVDSLHSDLRRSRASNLSMIPTSTGAAKAVGLVLPELLGKLDGTAIRIPTPNVSMIDFTFNSKRNTSPEEINKIVRSEANSNYKDIVALNNSPLVSIDFNHNPASSIFDLTQTQIVGHKFVRILSWYDNEWGFSNRMLDVSGYIGSLNGS